MIPMLQYLLQGLLGLNIIPRTRKLECVRQLIKHAATLAWTDWCHGVSCFIRSLSSHELVEGILLEALGSEEWSDKRTAILAKVCVYWYTLLLLTQ